jgi:DNA polymerase-3 subunit gamma/tau
VSAGPSLYRRHRPRTFAEVVGQDHVVRTLTNAVAGDKIHHAYLFVGSRGTGKTSMAKILAACLNCEHGPTITPCGVCQSCTSIAAATSLDVAEMDAASSNSVDDIRALRDSVAFAPISGHRKIYILDEAHMLSTAAWNAFLKTLEEPPPNTVFILATTDAQKVPATVIDRCHRFDFQRPSTDQIAIVLRRVAAAESIEIPDVATALLARHAAGSFRDALGLLEQLETYSAGTIALADVLAVLGISDAELLFKTIDAIATGDPRATLLALAAAVESGRDPAAFTRELEAHARELLITQTLGGTVPPEISLTPEHDARLTSQAQQVGPATLVRLLDLLAQALIAVKAGADARTQLELATVRAARPDLDPSTAAITARLERLEASTQSLKTHETSHEPQAAGPTNGAAGALHATPSPPAVRAPVAEQAPALAAPESVAAAPQKPVDRAQPRDSAPQATADRAQPRDSVPQAPVDRVEPRDPVAQAGESAGEDLPLTLQALIEAWPAVVATLRSENAMLGAVVEDAEPVELNGSRLVLAFAEDAAFLRRKAEDRASRTALSDAVTQVTGRSLSLDYALRAPGTKLAPENLSDEELVRRFKVEFDGEELRDDDDNREETP